MEDSGFANGLGIDQDNNIWIAHHCRKVSRTAPNGKNIVAASRYNGKKLNSPNDIAIRRDGSVWFTDPMYGITFKGFGCELAKEEQPVRGVYQIKDGEVFLKTGSIEIPNGIKSAALALFVKKFVIKETVKNRTERIIAGLESGKLFSILNAPYSARPVA